VKLTAEVFMIFDLDWINFFAALLTPIVAILGLCIAWWQLKTAQNKLKFELFDRRYSIYEAARVLLIAIVKNGNASDAEMLIFVLATRESKWLLNSDVAKYLEDDFLHKAIDLQTLQTERENALTDDERANISKKQSEIKKWFIVQPAVLGEKFTPFLGL
jgi:uncharacterized membrane protein YwzB